MKLKNLAIATLSIVALISCGKPMPESLCDCMELDLKMIKEIGFESISDTSVIKQYQDEFSSELEVCDSLSRQLSEEMMNLPREEQEAKRLEFIESCPSMTEMEAVYNEMQEKFMEQAMQDGGQDMGVEIEDVEEGLENVIENIDDQAGEIIENAAEEVELLK